MFEPKKSVTYWERIGPEMKIIASLFLLLLSSAPAFAQTGTLKGVVTDESEGVVAAGKRDVNQFLGAYSFSNVPLGEYVLQAWPENMAPHRPIFAIQEGLAVPSPRNGDSRFIRW